MAFRYGDDAVDPSSVHGLALQIQRRKDQDQEDARQYFIDQNAQRDELQAQRDAEQLKIDAELQRRRLGLNTFDEKLNDRYSDLYQWEEAPEGAAPVEIDVGGTDGKAPTGLSPLRRAARRRVIKPEHADALDQQGISSSRTRSVDEV